MTVLVDNYKIKYENQTLFLPLKTLMEREPHQTEIYHPEGIARRNSTIHKIRTRPGLTNEQVHTALNMLDKRAFAYKHMVTENGDPLELRGYQEGLANTWAPRVACQSSRSVGKSTLIELDALWLPQTYPGQQTLIAVQGESQEHPLMERIIRRHLDNPYLASTIKKITRQPKYCIEFKNGHILWSAICSNPTNVNGMHVMNILLDENQILSKEAWVELYRCLNPGGLSSIKLYGVPNGLRTSKFFEYTNDRKDWEWYHYSQLLIPQITLDDVVSAAKEYSDTGFPDFNNPDFHQQFLGLHSIPSRTGIDFNAYIKCVLRGLYIFINTPKGIFESSEERYVIDTFTSYNAEYLKELKEYIRAEGISQLFAGGDLGYTTDPTELVLYYQKDGKLVALGRFHFENLDYPSQCTIVSYFLNTLPIVRMGIDLGNNGLAVYQFLCARSEQYSERIKGFYANNKIVVGHTAEGLPQERAVKEFATSKIDAMLKTMEIVFREDRGRAEQYSNVVYRVTQHGNIVFPKGRDHILDADRNMVCAWHMYVNGLEASESGGVLDSVFMAGLAKKAASYEKSSHSTGGVSKIAIL
jgi:hypothetical protein